MNSSRLFALAAALPILIFAGCSSYSSATRELPPTDQVMKRGSARPAVTLGDDLGLVAARGFAWGEANACAAEQNRCAYDSVRASYAAGKAVGSSLPECVAATLKAYCDKPR